MKLRPLAILCFLFFLNPLGIFSYDKGDKITFGNYGGFTGMKTSFVLYGDGSIKKIDEKTLTEIDVKKLSKTKTKKAFRKTKKIKSLNINQKGNVNYFIEFSNSKEKLNNNWSSHSENPKLEKVYRLLIGFAVLK